MFGFSKNKECTKCLDSISKLESRIKALETDQINVEAQLKMIRDKVLRRFRTVSDEIKPEKEENINTGFPFPFRWVHFLVCKDKKKD